MISSHQGSIIVLSCNDTTRQRLKVSVVVLYITHCCVAYAIAYDELESKTK